ncbi:spore coat polysaccharide biosynthesis protein SpsF [Natranaerovirga pectinivora]|uniref:Spore coat polysaccharide biosynthesis protein SpsF n=1 Tax=Natranaerovirga pectinivora TaxID=682400 RepID=A0A4R3MKC6_9FIRM|nr:glycosyltransferase family protein [Natranaerovirga pectinivora]TCT14036.1 spore coat polysaccharide biosynthesis protein SpsF [Natranaerovirga pectinivora]
MVICIVQARTGSTRLKGKVLKKILDIPMILITLKRLENARYIDKLILATSDKEEDDNLYNIVKGEGYIVFRGDENNVLQRFVNCIDVYGGNTIIRITGDCPLIDPDIVDYVASYYKMHCYEYVRLDVPNSFIRGFDVEIFSREALLKTYELSSQDKHKEHVTLFMYNNPQYFNLGTIKGNDFYSKDYRLCVDTAEDFKLVEIIFSKFNNIFVSSREVVQFLDSNLNIAKMNQNVIQKKF